MRDPYVYFLKTTAAGGAVQTGSAEGTVWTAALSSASSAAASAASAAAQPPHTQAPCLTVTDGLACVWSVSFDDTAASELKKCINRQPGDNSAARVEKFTALVSSYINAAARQTGEIVCVLDAKLSAPRLRLTLKTVSNQYSFCLDPAKGAEARRDQLAPMLCALRDDAQRREAAEANVAALQTELETTRKRYDALGRTTATEQTAQLDCFLKLLNAKKVEIARLQQRGSGASAASSSSSSSSAGRARRGAARDAVYESDGSSDESDDAETRERKVRGSTKRDRGGQQQSGDGRGKKQRNSTVHKQPMPPPAKGKETAARSGSESGGAAAAIAAPAPAPAPAPVASALRAPSVAEQGNALDDLFDDLL